MPFITKRDLLANENCGSWITIGADTYMSVSNKSANYTRIYKSTNGGPLQTILNITSLQPTPWLFNIGGVLHSIAGTAAQNGVYIKRYVSNAWENVTSTGMADVIQHKEHNGTHYFLLMGYTISGGFSVFNKTTLVKLVNSGGFWTLELIKLLEASEFMTSFDIDPTTDNFFITTIPYVPGVGPVPKVLKRTPLGVEETLLTFADSPFYQILYKTALLEGVLYLFKRNPVTGTGFTLSRLTSLTVGATEDIVNDSITAGISSPNSYPKAVRMQAINETLVIAYQATAASSTFTTNTLTYDGTTLTLLTNYPTNYNYEDVGTFTIEGDIIILGVLGKYVYLFVEDPDDPEEPPVEEISEQLTEEILIEVRPAPCNAITLTWLNTLGGWDMFCFEDLNGTFETEIKTRIEAEYERYIEQLDTDTNTTGITTKSVERNIRLGADSVDPDIFIGLLDLFTSPSVFMLVSTTPIKWQSVRVSPGTIRYSEKDQNIEITIELPNLFLQRS